jgi:hypothetical protein
MTHLPKVLREHSIALVAYAQGDSGRRTTACGQGQNHGTRLPTLHLRGTKSLQRLPREDRQA